MNLCSQNGTILLTALLVASFSMTAAAEHPHHPPYRVHYKRKVIVVQPPPPPRRVRTIRRIERVEVVRPAPQRRASKERLGIGIRANGTGLDGNKLGLEDVENPAMGGIGVHLRTDMGQHWGLEISADFLHGEKTDQGFKQTTVPIMLNALYYFVPNSAINPYVLAGAGVHFTKLSYLEGQFEHHILEVAGQAGFGVRVRLGDSFAVHGDLRFLSVYKNLGNVNHVSNKCLKSNASGITGFCDGLEALDPSDKFNIGAQFQAGATYYF